LISKPEETVQELCAFLNIAYADSMMQYYTSNTSKITAASGEMWSNLEKPIIANNTNKFLSEFKEDELEIFELIAGDTLKALGYNLYSTKPDQGLLSASNIVAYGLQNIEKKKEVLKNARQSDLEKRAGQESILKKIKERMR
jgi:hypothetical protein